MAQTKEEQLEHDGAAECTVGGIETSERSPDSTLHPSRSYKGVDHHPIITPWSAQVTAGYKSNPNT